MSPFKVGTITINLAVLAYLLWAKRLFGVRGGAARADEIRHPECGWNAIERSTPELVVASAGSLRSHRVQ